MRVNGSEGMRTVKMTFLLVLEALIGLAGTVLESSLCWCSQGRISRLTSSATTQAQVQRFELAHPLTYPKSTSFVNCWHM